ncbi:MAG: hypothetical protein JETT_3967 [Candidatus Jettenia ecosi]|uniref:Uncharacterized protein n=1 Tax=Candidatus Jettenia ecosi TaxID=2494326 RepID=A0A533Q5H2_9BACT|nr:MAG: hypothetical protein JETT_3967 [Candidatus Jettenia ecosi]
MQYIKKVFESVLRSSLNSQRQKISPELLAGFHRVFLQDSTQCSLHEKLAEKLRGSGGSASKSALKIQLLYELKSKTVSRNYSLRKAEFLIRLRQRPF